MLRLEFYPFMHGVQMRAVGTDLNRNADGSKREGESVERTITTASIEDLGLAGALAKALWELHSDFPGVHKYARR